MQFFFKCARELCSIVITCVLIDEKCALNALKHGLNTVFCYNLFYLPQIDNQSLKLPVILLLLNNKVDIKNNLFAIYWLLILYYL